MWNKRVWCSEWHWDRPLYLRAPIRLQACHKLLIAIESLENGSSTLLPLTQWSLRPFLTFDAQRPFWDQDFKSILCVVSTIPWQDGHSEHETFLRARQWGYFGSTLRQIALCMIQFLLYNIVGHTTDCVVFVLLHAFQQLFYMTKSEKSPAS